MHVKAAADYKLEKLSKNINSDRKILIPSTSDRQLD